MKATGKGYNAGATRKRVQVYNPKTGMWTVIDKETGQFIRGRPEPYKNIERI